ncbi:hypothetical protein FRC07_006191, partial [Ceratobasidium sp. 392]
MTSLIDSWSFGETVRAIAVSPDGARVGVGGSKTVAMWDIRTGQRTAGPLKGHSSPVQCVAFSPDGRTLASGSRDKTVRIWNTETGKEVARPLTGHTGWVTSVTFLHDNWLVMSGSDDWTVRVWDARTGSSVRKPVNVGIGVWSLALSPNGRLAVGGIGNHAIKVYDHMAISDAALFECAGHEDAVYSVSFSPNSRLIASGSQDCTVRIWDAASGLPIGKPLEGHTDRVWSVAFSPDNKHLVSCSQDDTIRIWDVEAGAMHGEPLLGHTSTVHGVTFTPDGNHFISCSSDFTVKIWTIHSLDMQTGTIDARTPMEEQSPKQAVSRLDVRECANIMDQLEITANSEAEITSTSTTEEIVSRLCLRGCADMTDRLDWTTCSERPISSGGFGDIYRCTLKDRTEVAIKTIRLYVGSSEQDQKILKYAAREVYTWSKCKHVNVQPLLGLVVFRGHIGMIARWEANGSLPQYLERHADADRCAMSTAIAEGLSYLHASGVVHGDLKGANVLVSQDGVAQLADFGNATLQEYSLQFTTTSSKSAFSSRWAAPELFQGSPCNYATDVYALGM